MRRRDFIALGGAAIAWPRAAQASEMRRLAVLTTFGGSDALAQGWDAAFRKGLDESGWHDGRNVKIDYRWAAGDADRLRAFAQELVALQPDVIFAVTTPAVAALLREMRAVPIVFAQVSDPVGLGFVASLARPGGNVTGFTNINIESSIGGKWLELLKEIAPAVRRVAMIYNPPTASFAGYYLRPFEAAGPASGVQASAAAVHSDADIENAIEALAREPGGGFVVLPDTFTGIHRDQIVSLAAATVCPRCIHFAGSRKSAACFHMASIPTTCFVARLPTSIAFSKVPSPLTFRCRHRPNTNWSSISRPPRHWGCQIPKLSCRAPTM
jgi:putative ABC transport system substrate-binding protein